MILRRNLVVLCFLGAVPAIAQPTADLAFGQVSPQTPTVRANAAISLATYTIESSTNPFLNFDMLAFPSTRLEPGQKFTTLVRISNNGRMAHDLTVTLTLPDGGRFIALTPMFAGDRCRIEGSTAVCVTAELATGAGGTLTAFIAAPEAGGGRVRLVLTVAAREPDDNPMDHTLRSEAPVYRNLVVTNADDDGPGSLRQAMRDANELCNDDICRILFDLSAPVTIRPRTPLPEIIANQLIIDGGTQKVWIRGDLLAEGDGISLSTLCDASVLGLTIEKFPRNGILLLRGSSLLDDCRAGSVRKLEGNTLSENGEGIFIDTDQRVDSLLLKTSIAGNVITNSSAGGISVAGGVRMDIRNNQIRANGGSGIVFGSVNYSAIVNNLIAGNEQARITLAPEARTEIFGNSIVDNGLLGIDIGPDVVPPNAGDDSNRAPNAPVLASAYIDAATGKTVVRGRVDSALVICVGYPYWKVDLYASDSLNVRGLAQGERLVRSEVPVANGHYDFRAVIDQKLAGKIITATLTRQCIFAAPEVAAAILFFSTAETSEFSNPLTVMPWQGRRRSAMSFTP